MITYYCPHCWLEIRKNIEKCPSCDYVISQFSDLEFEEKLMTALHHPIFERRIIAAQVLGNRKSQKALGEFLKIIQSDENDYYFLKAILTAAAKISHPLRDQILQIASNHSSELVAKLALQYIDELKHGKP